MRCIRGTIWLWSLLCGLPAGIAAAQSQVSGPAPDSVAPAPDSAAPEGKKKGGLFGKAKKFVGDKTVQQVAKTVACTVVPGGQVVAGAIDAASSDDVGDAAAGAAGAAAGQTCMPGGMGGMAGMGAAGVGMPGAMPTGAMPMDAMGDEEMPGMPSPDQVAACLGMTTEEYLAFTDPTNGEPRSPTKAEMKRQREASKKMDMGRYQSCMMQQYSANMAATSGTMAASRAGTSEPVPPAASPSGPGADLAKGKAVVKDIAWVDGEAKVSEQSIPGFTAAMSELAAAISTGGGNYRADLYLDKSLADDDAAKLGAARLQVVLASLEAAGAGTGVVASGKVKKDKNPRLEIVRDKK